MPWADRHQATFYQAIQRGDLPGTAEGGAGVDSGVFVSVDIYVDNLFTGTGTDSCRPSVNVMM